MPAGPSGKFRGSSLSYASVADSFSSNAGCGREDKSRLAFLFSQGFLHSSESFYFVVITYAKKITKLRFWFENPSLNQSFYYYLRKDISPYTHHFNKKKMVQSIL